MDYARQHLAEVGRILGQLDVAAIERMLASWPPCVTRAADCFS
jgi:hypothetical protein